MKRLIVTIATVVWALGVPGIASAHGGHHQVLFGTVASLGEGRMSVSTDEQKSVVVTLGPSTSYVLVDGTAGKLSDLHEGMRVVVKVAPDDGVADEVRYAPAGGTPVPEAHDYGLGHDHAHGNGIHE